MPILGDNTISKSTQLHRTFEGRTDWASQTELLNREAELDAIQEQEAEKAEAEFDFSFAARANACLTDVSE